MRRVLLQLQQEDGLARWWAEEEPPESKAIGKTVGEKPAEEPKAARAQAAQKAAEAKAAQEVHEMKFEATQVRVTEANATQEVLSAVSEAK